VSARGRADGIAVRHVVVGQPGARAGVKPGDRMLAIDGHDVAGEDLLEAQQRLSGSAGTHVRVQARGPRRSTSSGLP
jgi:carboxyl-terminal processing protease